jgi:mannose-1-phosphate guanylyltransferase
MRAMVLAAGYGERMRPLTRVLPKPALPLVGAPLLTHALRGLARHGVDRVVVNSHHLPSVLAEVLPPPARLGLEAVEVSHETELLGTAGGVRRAASWLRGAGTLVIRNSDFLADVPLAGVLETHRARGALATLVLAPARSGYSAVSVDAEGRILSLAGKPEVDPARVAGTYLFTGFQLVEEEVIDLIPASGPSDLVRDVYRGLASEARLHAFVHSGFWWEFGTPLHYLEGTCRVLRLGEKERTRLLDPALSDPVSSRGRAVLALGEGGSLGRDVALEGAVAVGRGVEIGDRSQLEDVVALPGARIGSRATLRRVIVGPGTAIAGGESLEDVVACAGELAPLGAPTR